MRTRWIRASNSSKRENRRLQRKLQRADTIITRQKTVAEILGIPLKPLDNDEPD